MRNLLGVSLLSFYSLLLGPPAPPLDVFDNLFEFEEPQSEHAATFRNLIEQCAMNYKSFNEMLRELAVEAPKVSTSFSESVRMVVNRGFYSCHPVFFRIDLKDLEVFPERVPVDDIPSWATTRCEFLAHELTEVSALAAVARALGEKRKKHEVAQAVYDAYPNAHELGIQQENRLRRERAEVSMRSGECNVPLGRSSNAEYSYVVYGEHTQEMLLIEADLIDIEYSAKENKCEGLDKK